MTDLIGTIKIEFPTRRVAIVGDVVADQFLNGSIARVSREAPVFILRHEDTETRPGGAANAAANVASLGGTAMLGGVLGDDANGRLLSDSLDKVGVNCDYSITDSKFATTTKVRVFAGQNYSTRQQVIRIDYENNSTIDDDIRRRLGENLRVAAQHADAIIVSDYNYGVAEPEVFREAYRISKERNIPLLIDSRFRLRNFANATSATPNQEEVEQLLGR